MAPGAPARDPGSAGRRWIPDLALAGALATLFYCLFLFDGYRALFRDSDSGWHIAAGESMLSSRNLPRLDPYSFSKPGEAWFAWEWGSDILMGTVHRLAGLRGVAIVFAVALAAATWFWFRLTWITGGNFLIACLLAPLMLTTTGLHWLARPHVFGWLFLLGAVIAAERAPARFAWRHGFWIALVTSMWTNMHASFFLAPALALLYAGSHAVTPLIWRVDGRGDWYLRAAAVSAAATLINPYGWNLHRHVFRYLADSELIARIGEFQSFNFHAAGAGQIALAVMVSVAGGLAALRRQRLAQCLLLFGLAGLALRSARVLPLMALVALPLANGAITEALAGALDLRPWLRRWLDDVLEYGKRLRAIDARCGGLVWVPAILLVAVAVPATHAGFPPDQFPVEASSRVEELPAGARILAPDKFGGYLIYRFAGKRKVFFDGRSDFYGSEFLKEYGRLVQVRPGWKVILDRYQFTHALLPSDYSLAAALEREGWKRLHRDSVATLLERP